jgi:hypothetical protein
VLFVDHDPARLAGQVDERWSLEGGRVTVIGVDVRAGKATADVDGDEAARQATMTIEVAGLDAGSIAQLARLPGVESIARADAQVVVTALAARSDELLRELLAWDGVHVHSVRPVPEMLP